MIADVLLAAIGLVFGLFLPGLLVVLLFFEELNWPARVAFSFLFSLMIDLAIAILLGYDKAQAAFTGGITSRTVWIGELGVTSLLLIALIIKLYMKKRGPEDNGMERELKK